MDFALRRAVQTAWLGKQGCGADRNQYRKREKDFHVLLPVKRVFLNVPVSRGAD